MKKIAAGADAIVLVVLAEKADTLKGAREKFVEAIEKNRY